MIIISPQSFLVVFIISFTEKPSATNISLLVFLFFVPRKKILFCDAAVINI